MEKLLEEAPAEEKHDVDAEPVEDKEAPAEEDKEAPLVEKEEDKEAPPAKEDTEAPLAEEEEHKEAPPAKEDKEAPPVEKEEDKEAPPAKEDTEAPLAEEEEHKEAPPAKEDKKAPLAKEDKEAPAEEKHVVDLNVFSIPDDILSKIVAALPSREAFRTSVLSKANERMLREPLFLRTHLAPRPLLIGDEPIYIFVQPTDFRRSGRRPGYTHVTLVNVHNNPKQNIFYNLPVKDEKTSAIHFQIGRGATPAPDFFQQTLCLLDAEVVASHGRLVLARSDTNYFVCNPERNCWVKLPLPPVVKPICYTAAGFCYDDLDGSCKEIDFNAVLLVRDGGGLVVQTLSSRVGTWAETNLGVNPIAKHLPPRSPGVFCEQRCYWISQVDGQLVCYDKGTGLLSVVGQPPLSDMHPTRFNASLGSTGGKLRFSCCDIRDPHNKGGNSRWGSGGPVPAAIKVWKLNDAAADEWYQLYEDVMPLMYKATMRDPMDFASASNRTMILKHPERLLARNLDTGVDTFLTNLSALHSLYWSYFIFPYFG